MTHLSISLFGPFQVTVDGVPVTGIESDKGRALLAYLAVEPDHPHRRDTLAGLLWPERPDRSARHNLSQALSDLRHAIGDRDAAQPLLAVTRQTVQCTAASEHWLDVKSFAAQAAGCGEHSSSQHGTCDRCLDLFQGAAALYRGPFLQGFSLSDCSAFEEWCVVHRERFHLQVLDVLHRLVGELERRGGMEQALGYARRQLELDPWREEAHRTVMRLLAQMGQRGAALAQYEICRRTLEEELGVEPEAGTTALQKRIRAGDLAARRPTPPHNLPAPVTPFVGREAELADLGGRLQDPACRLLTLVGPGGIGKTRLAREAAAAQLDGFPDGVYAVDLAALESSESIIPTVAQALGFSFSEGEEPSKQLLAYLRGKRMLLILDSFEHVLAGAGWVTETLRAAPDLKALVTSRSKLNLKAEHLFPVDGLNYPEEESTQDAADHDAVRLFLQAAQRVRPEWKPTDSELIEVAHICRMVEGMPLAILLAAAWVEMLSPAEIAGELGRGIDFLAADWQDVPPRHRSIHAVFDWSRDLLTEREQEVFRALSVFRGGFTQGAAENVTGAWLRELQSLVDRSLLSHTPGGRYEMHDLVRQYAGGKLDESPDAWKDAHDRHSAYYADALHRWEAELKGARQQVALAELDQEIENGRAAWDWVAERQQLERLERSLAGLCLFYEHRSRYQEGTSACSAAAAPLTETTADERSVQNLAGDRVEWLRFQARALAWQGRFEWLMRQPELARRSLQQSQALLERPELLGADTRSERAFVLLEMGNQTVHADPDTAQQLCEQSLELYRGLEDRWGIAGSLEWLSYLAFNLGRYDDVRLWGEECLAIRRDLGDRRGIATLLLSMSAALGYQGQSEECEHLARERIAIHRELGDRAGVADGLRHLGGALYLFGRFDEACTALEESLPVLTDLGMRHYGLAFAYAMLGYTKVQLGRYDEVTAHAEEGLVLSRELGYQRGVAWSLSSLGFLALLGEEWDKAHELTTEAVSVFRAIKQRDEFAAALAMLLLANLRLGRPLLARQNLLEALSVVADTQAVGPFYWTILPITALLYLDQGDPERAVEMYACASRSPFVANSQWLEDVVGRHITAASEGLPPGVAEAARERGRARDLQITVAELLEMMRGGEQCDA